MHKLFEFIKRQYDQQPPWAKQMETKIMSALTDLQSSIADLGTQLATNNADIEAELAKITTPGTSDADIEASVATIRTLIAANKVETDKLATPAGT